MPDGQNGFASARGPSTQGSAANEVTATLSRASIKVGLAVFLPAGLFLFLLSRHNYLLIHSLIEFSSIVLMTAVFLIGWNTRSLVQNQFFTIMAAGFLAAGMVDLLHTLTYKGMQLFIVPSADVPTQLWLIARTLGTLAFLFASLSLGRKDFCSDRAWLLGFLLGSAWPVLESASYDSAAFRNWYECPVGVDVHSLCRCLRFHEFSRALFQAWQCLADLPCPGRGNLAFSLRDALS